MFIPPIYGDRGMVYGIAIATLDTILPSKVPLKTLGIYCLASPHDVENLERNIKSPLEALIWESGIYSIWKAINLEDKTGMPRKVRIDVTVEEAKQLQARQVKGTGSLCFFLRMVRPKVANIRRTTSNPEQFFSQP